MARPKPQTLRVESIDRLGDAPAESLKNHGVETVDDLWGDDRVGLAGRLQRTANSAGLAQETLYAILIADAVGTLRPKRKARRFLTAAGRHGVELAFFTLLLAAALLLVARGWSVGRGFVQRVAVKGGATLAPYRAVDPADLTLVTAAGGGGFSAVEEVSGRYTSETVPAGKRVTEAQLLPKELSNELRGRHLFVVPVSQAASGQAIKTPATVWLLFPPPGEKLPAALVVRDVMLLGVKRDGDRVTATVAVTEAGLAEMKDYAGRTEAIVLQPAAPSGTPAAAGEPKG
jgi:hypothetical protein